MKYYIREKISYSWYGTRVFFIVLDYFLNISRLMMSNSLLDVKKDEISVGLNYSVTASVV